MSNIERNLIKGYIESSKDKLYALLDDLYNINPNKDHEKNAFNILSTFLKENGFFINNNIQQIENTFIAEIGNGSKKIGFFCEFEVLKEGYTNGHNIQCVMNIGSALGLTRVLDKIDSKIIIYGLPKEESLPLKITLSNRHIFDDLDLIICAHPGEKTYESVGSMAMSIMKFEFTGKRASFNLNPNEGISSLNPIIKFLDIIQDLKSEFNSHLVNYVINCDNQDIFIIPEKSEYTIGVKATDMMVLEKIKDKIIESAKFISKVYSCDFDYKVESEYMPFKKNVELIKLTSHNLKECGIINIHGPLSSALSLDIGLISHRIPTVHPYIGICENGERYGTIEFKEATIKNYAKDMMIKASCALALTAYDWIFKSSNLP